MQSTDFSKPTNGQSHPPYPLPTYQPAYQPTYQPAPAPPATSLSSVNQSNTTVVVNQPGGGGGSGSSRLVVVEKHQLNARSWNSGLCGCLNDLGGCMLTWMCCPIMMCRLANRLNECALVTCCVPGAFGSLRTKLRVMGGIKGSICKDCVVTTCCGPCAVCQMYREMDDMQL